MDRQGMTEIWIERGWVRVDMVWERESVGVTQAEDTVYATDRKREKDRMMRAWSL